MKAARLQAELLLLRYGWSPVVAALLAAVAAWLHFVSLPELAAAGAHQAQALALLKAGAAAEPVPKTSLVEQRYRDFRNHLSPRRALPEVIRTFFAAARRNGLALQKVDYSLARPAAGEYLVYRIDVPLAGPYRAVREFAQDILDKVPAAALEEAAFKRSAVGSASAEARLRFALYLREEE